MNSTGPTEKNKHDKYIYINEQNLVS